MGRGDNMLEKRLIETMFSRAGIVVNGSNPWDIQINDDRLYARLLRDKNLGLGEAYMEGIWSCRQVDEFIYRIQKANLDDGIRNNIKFLLPQLGAMLFNPQSRSRSRHVAERHYNLGNDLFMSFLDPYNQYSCAYFHGTEDLAEAQRNKLDLICKKIELKPQDHVL